ncbi:MAG: sigma-70 family RNA polymerase sigma factor [Verrucomicrobia bacterium]|nr:sigma-70 family RNA polymerase sigma factor [Verrucomicrobiota bacterium]
MSDSASLLTRYARQRDERAFAELVERHVNLVFGTARRITGDAARAEEVTQAVFADLARKAAELPPAVVIEGWLHRAAWLAATKVVRDDRRRQEREQQAMEAHPTIGLNEADQREAERLQPVLDDALSQLTDADREAVVLRYLAGRSFAEIGGLLGCTDDAAQKRVSRALVRLREVFRHRGITASDGVLGAALALAGAQLAPGGLATAAAATAAASLETAGWLHTLLMMKTKIALTGAVIALVLAPLTWQQLELRRLRGENRSLREEAAEQEVLRAAAEKRAAARATEAEAVRRRSETERLELLRLRDEVGKLRVAQRSGAPPRPLDSAPPMPARLMPAQVLLPPTTVRVPDGMTLLAGGWMTPGGKQGLMLVTPQVGGEDGETGAQVTVRCTLLEGSPEAFAAVDLGGLAGGGSWVTSEPMSNEAAAALVQKLAQSGEVDVLAAPGVSTLDGRQAQIASGVGGGMATAVDILPRIQPSADGTTVEMTLTVTQTPMEPPVSGPQTMPLPAFPSPAETSPPAPPDAGLPFTAPTAIETTTKPQP